MLPLISREEALRLGALTEPAEIEALLRDPARLEDLGRRARATVQDQFTWDRCGQDTVTAYADVLATGRHSSM